MKTVLDWSTAPPPWNIKGPKIATALRCEMGLPVISGWDARHGRELRARRIDFGLTQQELGEIVGWSRSMICRWELGRIVPQPYAIKKLQAMGLVS